MLRVSLHSVTDVCACLKITLDQLCTADCTTIDLDKQLTPEQCLEIAFAVHSPECLGIFSVPFALVHSYRCAYVLFVAICQDDSPETC